MSLENVKHIVLVLSGKGGVGKSTITTQIALSLSLSNHSVGILDVDLTGPSIPRLLGLENAKITQAPGGWVPVQVHGAQTLLPYPRPRITVYDNGSAQPGEDNKSNGAATNGHPPTTPPPKETPIAPLHAASLAFLLPTRSSAVIWRGPKKTAMVRQFLTDVLWPPLDYLLIDTPPGTSDEHISLIETLLTKTTPATLPNPPTPDNANHPALATTAEKAQAKPQLAGAVIVTTPQAISTADVKKELNFCAKTGVPVLGVVENMAGYVCECCGEGTDLFGRGGGEEMSREFGVRFLGGVPMDGGWGRVIEEGGWGGFGKGGEGDVNDVGYGAEEGEDGVEKPEKALLVDRYRSCALSAVFNGITRELVGIIDGEDGGGERA